MDANPPETQPETRNSKPETSRRVRLRVAYDGTDFYGFQALPDRRTVQGTLQEAISRLCKEPVHVYGAGRTDAGVHASGQVVHFDTTGRTPPERYPEALAGFLPKDVSVLESGEAEGDFHARFSAQSRTYRYALFPGGRSPLIGRYAWMPREAPDWDLFRSESERLVGGHDFRLFRSGTEDQPTVRHVHRIGLRLDRGAGYLTLEANSFLRGMVRWIVGALWSRATGRMSEEQLTAMIEGHMRPKALTPAPPQGLCLVRVRYEEKNTEYRSQNTKEDFGWSKPSGPTDAHSVF